MATKERRLIRKDGATFGYTEALAARPDMMELMADGTIVPVYNKPKAVTISGSKDVEDAQDVGIKAVNTGDEPIEKGELVEVQPVKDALTELELGEMMRKQMRAYALARYDTKFPATWKNERIRSEIWRLQSEAQGNGKEDKAQT